MNVIQTRKKTRRYENSFLFLLKVWENRKISETDNIVKQLIIVSILKNKLQARCNLKKSLLLLYSHFLVYKLI